MDEVKLYDMLPRTTRVKLALCAYSDIVTGVQLLRSAASLPNLTVVPALEIEKQRCVSIRRGTNFTT